jgi:Rieske Fe-S protein
LLLRPDEQTFLAFHQKCPHLGCAVVPDEARKQLLCPCHNGCFDAATGRPIAGPARRPLTRIALENRDGVVYAVGVEEAPA